MPKKMLIMVIAGALVLMLLSVGVTWFLLRPDPVAPDADVDALDIDAQAQTEVLGPAIYYSIQPAFVVNYPVGNRVRFLQVELSVLARDDESIAVINNHMPLIRNNILIALQGQDIQTLLTDAGKTQLQLDITSVIQEVVNAHLGRPGIESVLFINFVVQ